MEMEERGGGEWKEGKDKHADFPLHISISKNFNKIR